MKWIANLCLVAVGCLILSGCSHTKSARVEDYLGKYQVLEGKLPNGLEYLIVNNPRAPNTYVYHWVAAGSIHERAGITGIAHLFEHMMFRPLSPGASDFMTQIRDLGGSANANTRFNATVYHSQVPHGNVERLLRLEAARFRNLKVDQALLDIERKAVWSEYSTGLDNNPTFDLWRAWYADAYRETPMGWHIVGFKEDLDKISATDCMEFFGKYYGPQNTRIVVVGDVNLGQIEATIKRHYGDWSGRGFVNNRKEQFMVNRRTERVFGYGQLPSQNVNILFGYRTPISTKESAVAWMFLDHVMFGSDYSLATRVLDFDSKIVSRIGGFNALYDEGGFKGMMTLKSPKDRNIALGLVESLPRRLKRVSSKEWQAYWNEFQIGLVEGVERNADLAEGMATGWGKFDEWRIIETARSAQFAVVKEQVLALAGEYLIPKNFVVVQSAKAPKGDN